MPRGQGGSDLGGSEWDRVLLSFSHQVGGKAAEGPRLPTSQARAVSFCTQIVVVAGLQRLSRNGPPRPIGLHSLEVSIAECAHMYLGTFWTERRPLTVSLVKLIVSKEGCHPSLPSLYVYATSTAGK